MSTSQTKAFRFASALMLFSALALLLVGCSGQPTSTGSKPVVFGYADWDTQQFMTRLAGFIVANGYQQPVEYAPGANVALVVAIQSDDVDVHMEVAERSLQEPLQRLIDSGKGEKLGISFGGTWQGWLVPTYLIKGDPARGIAPMAPGLKSVLDLPKYWELFKDPEVPTKGRFYSGVPGWQALVTNEAKIKSYGLEDYINIFIPGSDTALSTSIVAANEKGEPWLGYYWAPTWLLAKVDMTPLEEPPFDEKLWNAEAGYACAYPLDENYIVANTGLKARAPDVADFLSRFNVSFDDLSAVLLYMKDNNATPEQAAGWFLKEHESVWTAWVSPQVAQNVKAALP
ncbi:MAG: ABC transporter substrate-binding protein [Dehalococcoidales bacterium]|nr:ABC transporter substrate-binding protein [Dehalococcoidales bacterium]